MSEPLHNEPIYPVGYIVTRFRADGTVVQDSCRWGSDCHGLGRAHPEEFVWYTITRNSDRHVVCEMMYDVPVLRRNMPGRWVDVTHAEYRFTTRPDEIPRFGRAPTGGSAAQPPEPVHVPLQDLRGGPKHAT